MSYGYSKDLRLKVLSYYDRCHLKSLVCEVFGIHRQTLSRWLTLRDTDGCSLDIKPRVKKSHKIDSDKLRSYIASHPDAYLSEIAKEFSVSDVAILYACRRLKIVRKKNRIIS